MTADELAGLAVVPPAELFARAGRVLGAQLDAGQAACRYIADLGHAGTHRNCRACSVLADAEVAGLWTPDEPERTTT